MMVVVALAIWQSQQNPASLNSREIKQPKPAAPDDIFADPLSNPDNNLEGNSNQPSTESPGGNNPQSPFLKIPTPNASDGADSNSGLPSFFPSLLGQGRQPGASLQNKQQPKSGKNGLPQIFAPLIPNVNAKSPSSPVQPSLLKPLPSPNSIAEESPLSAAIKQLNQNPNATATSGNQSSSVNPNNNNNNNNNSRQPSPLPQSLPYSPGYGYGGVPQIQQPAANPYGYGYGGAVPPSQQSAPNPYGYGYGGSIPPSQPVAPNPTVTTVPSTRQPAPNYNYYGGTTAPVPQPYSSQPYPNNAPNYQNNQPNYGVQRPNYQPTINF
jgi:hypothetical protein